MSNEVEMRLESLVGRGFCGGNIQLDDKKGELASYRSIEIYFNGMVVGLIYFDWRLLFH
ncbi:hypothetical protein [Burkholderia sp. LMG 21824]|uniref:hypothetical protein n=1 Tax=Burkholderia sp. LMG 21824 TaxID=3158172 RepID=UPI003C2F4A41